MRPRLRQHPLDPQQRRSPGSGLLVPARAAAPARAARQAPAVVHQGILRTPRFLGTDTGRPISIPKLFPSPWSFPSLGSLLSPPSPENPSLRQSTKFGFARSAGGIHVTGECPGKKPLRQIVWRCIKHKIESALRQQLSRKEVNDARSPAPRRLRRMGRATFSRRALAPNTRGSRVHASPRHNDAAYRQPRLPRARVHERARHAWRPDKTGHSGHHPSRPRA